MSYEYDFAIDLDSQNLAALKRKKKKLNELLDKYGESREAIDQHSTPEDWMEYQFAQGDQYINEILEERRLKRTQNAFPQTPFPSLAQGNPNYTTPTNLPETEEYNTLAKNKWRKEKRNILLERARNTINEFEGITNYFYLDSKGNISTARGENADDYNVFMELPSLKENRLANNTEKNAAYHTLKKRQREGYYGTNHPAKDYENLTPLRISKETIDKLTNKHLENDIQSLQKTFPEFDDFPLPLQEVLTDTHYNTGNINHSNWPNLHRGIKNKDLSAIANNIHRKDVQPKRNDWALEKIKSISSW